jgi:hypothetical protein
MAILIKKDGQNIYVSGTGIITNPEKKRAEDLSNELKTTFSNIDIEFVKSGLLTKGGTKKDALQIWYTIGKLLNEIIDKHKIKGSVDEPYFWQSVYDYIPKSIQKNSPPKRSSEWKRNHFRLCAKLAERKLEDVISVGNWSVWRDLYDNKKLLEDERVLNFVVNKIIEIGKGHKEFRPYIHGIRKNLKRVDTSVLNDSELKDKLTKIFSDIGTTTLIE